MAKTSLPVVKVKITFELSEKERKRFQAKCKKAGVSVSERLRQLMAQDVKV